MFFFPSSDFNEELLKSVERRERMTAERKDRSYILYRNGSTDAQQFLIRLGCTIKT